MTTFELYLLTRVVELKTLFGILLTTLGLIGGMATIGGIIHFMVEGDAGGAKKAGKAIRPYIIGYAMLAVAFVLVPTYKDLAIIYGGYFATNSEEVKKLPENVAKTLNAFMDDVNKGLEQ